MSNLKSALKAAKNAIQEKEFSSALYNCELALRHDPENYHARVFMGLAYFNLQKYQESENCYLEAVEKNETDLLAYQGLLNLYTARNHVQGLLDTWDKLRKLHMKLQEFEKYLEYTQNIIEKSLQIKDDPRALQLLKELLKYSNEKPGLINLETTLEQIILVQEQKFDKMVADEVHKRKFRLGAPPISVLQVQVESEFLQKFEPLEFYYDSLIQLVSPNKKTEISLRYFLYLNKKLLVVSMEDGKEHLRQVMDTIADDLTSTNSIIVKYKLERIDFADFEELFSTWDQWNHEEIDSVYTTLFDLIKKRNTIDPQDGLSKLSDLKIIDSRLGSMLYAFFLSSSTDFNGTANYCRQTIQDLKKREFEEAIPVRRSISALNLTLALSLLHLNDEEVSNAEILFSNILDEDDSNLTALLGLSKAYEIRRKYQESLDVLLKKEQRFISDPNFRIYLGWAFYGVANYERAIELLLSCQEAEVSRDLELDLKIGKTYWMMGGEYKSEKKYSFTFFLKAAKENADSHVPFEYLGRFYLLLGDKDRAVKCFKKSLENNETHCEVAKLLFDLLLFQNNKEEASEVAHLMSDSHETNQKCPWASIYLGKMYRTSGDYSNSIFYLQLSLKSNPDNLNAWVVLGDSYEKQGRFVSAIKSFSKAKSYLGGFDPLAGYILFRIGRLKSIIGIYESSLMDLNESLSVMNSAGINKNPVISALIGTYIDFSRDRFKLGYIGESFDICLKAFDAILMYLQGHPKETLDRKFLLLLLKHIFDLFSHIIEIPSLAKKFPQSKIEQIQKAIFGSIDYEKKISIFDVALSIMNEIIKLNPNEASHYYDISRLYYRYGTSSDSNSLAVKFCSKALQLDPSSSTYWNAFGILTMNSDPQISQHAFIESIELNASNSAISWTNLGILYLKNQDVSLALECFTQAQTVDPEWSNSWCCQSFCKEIIGEDSITNLQHASSLDNLNHELNLMLAEKVVTEIIESKHVNPELLSECDFLLTKSKELGVLNVHGLNVHGLVSELKGNFEKAVSIYEDALSSCDSSDEKSCVSRNLSRASLAIGKTKECLKVHDNLIDDDYNAATYVIRALALYFSGQLQDSISLFERILTMFESDRNDRKSAQFILLSLARVLTAVATEESIEIAKHQLLAAFQQDPSFLPALSSLLALGIKYQSRDFCATVINEFHDHPIDLYDQEQLKEFCVVKSLFYQWQNEKHLSRTEILKLLRMNPIDSDLWNTLEHVQFIFFPDEKEELNSIQGARVVISSEHSTLSPVADFDFSNDLVSIQKSLKSSPSNIWTWARLHDNRIREIKKASTTCALTETSNISELNDIYEKLSSLSGYATVEQSAIIQIMMADVLCILYDTSKDDMMNERVHAIDGAIQKCSRWNTKKIGYIVLSKCLYKLGLSQQSLETLQHAQNLFPSSWIVTTALVNYHLLAGNFDQAISILKSFISEYPQMFHIPSYFLMAYSALLAQDIATMNEAVNNILKDDPKNDQARFLQALSCVSGDNFSKAQKILANIDHPLKQRLIQIISNKDTK